jgi:hypothetical protein
MCNMRIDVNVRNEKQAEEIRADRDGDAYM